MTTEVRPVGVRCNLQCLYCYQNHERDAGHILHSYDMDKMKAALEERNVRFTVFGGEGLLMPEEDLETLWSWGYERFGGNGIQTNATILTEKHIELFKKYKVNVGVSCDGPGALNDARWNGTLAKTREATAKTHAAIERLAREGVGVSLIVTLHRGNATADKLPVMHDWFRHLDDLGVTSARLHPLEVETESVRQKFALSTEENYNALLSFYELEKELRALRTDVFKDLMSMLLGDDGNATCVWKGCDPYTTEAMYGVEGDGRICNCTRINKEGVDFVKSKIRGYERYLALYYTPQEYGGCRECRLFLMCRGGCPGTAIGMDWRNRTEYCELWSKLYAYLEGEMLRRGAHLLSQHPHWKLIEKTMVDGWSQGIMLSLSEIRSTIDGYSGPPAAREEMLAEFIRSKARRATTNGDNVHGDHCDRGS